MVRVMASSQWRSHTRCVRCVRTPCENSNFWVCEVLIYLNLRPVLSRGVDVNSEVPERSMKISIEHRSGSSRPTRTSTVYDRSASDLLFITPKLTRSHLCYFS